MRKHAYPQVEGHAFAKARKHGTHKSKGDGVLVASFRTIPATVVAVGILAALAAALPAAEKGAPATTKSVPIKGPGEAADAGKEKSPPEAPAQIEWRLSLETGLKDAAKSQRIILMLFGADWCQPCKVMERGTFGSKPIALYIERHFIPVRIDDSKTPSAASQTYSVRTYPTVIFLDPAGDVLHRQAGPMTPAEFQPLMERVAALLGLIASQKELPDDLEANFALGNSFAILNQMVRGAPYLERAAQLDPENKKGRLSQARLILAMTPLEEGDSAKTLGLLDKFEAEFKGAPEIPIAIFYRGAVLFQDGRLVEARKVFDGLRKDYPKHPQAYEADKAILAIDGRLKALKKLEEDKAAKKESPAAKDPAPPAEKTPAEPGPNAQPKPKG